MQNYQQLGTEIVATPAAIEAVPHSAVTDYQKIEAEFARYEAEAAAIKQRMDALNEQRESLREQERVIAIPELKARIAALGIAPEDLGYATQPKKSLAPSIPKYRNPETGETHSGKGACPAWLTPETKKDPRYLNPEWVANDEAKKAAKAAKAATKSKTESSSVSVAAEALASNVADVASNDAPTTADGHVPSVSDGGAEMTAANVAAVDAAHAGSESSNEAVVSNLS
ncbi:H-NS histone family protein [Paraburkholderia tropica]|uniref:H-NS histone family protein n=1 Tax=Paraburkholderia tropica TaxID=92647 RepID=UPI001603379E|nr:H-NS histone family protein [Paraburkholderia tropica]QNB10290.1 H-NS histone family protein [Paraburkholderia tropica]